MTPDAVLALVVLAGKFLIALAQPVVAAAPIVAFVVDHVLKRLPGWKDGNAGWANLILNMLFSGALFVAAQTGYQGQYDQAIKLSVDLLPILIRLVAGVGLAALLHNGMKLVGVGNSVTDSKTLPSGQIVNG